MNSKLLAATLPLLFVVLSSGCTSKLEEAREQAVNRNMQAELAKKELKDAEARHEELLGLQGSLYSECSHLRSELQFNKTMRETPEAPFSEQLRATKKLMDNPRYMEETERKMEEVCARAGRIDTSLDMSRDRIEEKAKAMEETSARAKEAQAQYIALGGNLAGLNEKPYRLPFFAYVLLGGGGIILVLFGLDRLGRLKLKKEQEAQRRTYHESLQSLREMAEKSERLLAQREQEVREGLARQIAQRLEQAREEAEADTRRKEAEKLALQREVEAMYAVYGAESDDKAAMARLQPPEPAPTPTANRDQAKFDYSLLDAELLELIAMGVNQNAAIVEKSQAPVEDTGTPSLVSRMDAINKRLQALRKSGKIIYERKTGWRIAGMTGE